MILDLAGLSDAEIQFNILHEFGHVLGLYHENQHPTYVDVMDKYWDGDKLQQFSGIEDCLEFSKQYHKVEDDCFKEEYDPNSIMHYP